MSFADRLCSGAYLEDIQVPEMANNAGAPPHVSLDFRGPKAILEHAQKRILAAAKENGMDTKADIATLKKGGGDAYLRITFANLHPDHTPERVLDIVHSATLCDISATISANVTQHQTSQEKEGEDTYIPSADITIAHKKPIVRQIVNNMLRRKLDEYFEGKFTIGNSGKIGLPSECFNNGGLSQCDIDTDKKIYLTFNDQFSDCGKHAHMTATAASEHLSGVLNIPEKIKGAGMSIGGNTDTQPTGKGPRPKGWKPEWN